MFVSDGQSVVVKDCISTLIPRGSKVTAGATAVSLDLSSMTNVCELEVNAVGADARLMWMPSVNTATVVLLGATPVTTVTAGAEYLLEVGEAGAALFTEGMTIEIFDTNTTTHLFTGVVQGKEGRAGKYPPVNPTKIRLIAPFGAMTIASVAVNCVVRYAIARHDTSNHYYIGTLIPSATTKRVVTPNWARYASIVRTDATDVRLIFTQTG